MFTLIQTLNLKHSTFNLKLSAMELKSFYKVRFNDCDPLGHLNNSKYIDYMLNAREDHLKEFHNIELVYFHQQGKGWVVANHEIFYIKPAFYNENVCITSRLIELTDSELLVEMLMYDEKMEKLKSILWSRFISISTQTGKKENHSNEFMQMGASMLEKLDTTGGIKSRIQELMGIREKAK
jgi:YbgC/YbaW family acyl-CoA thioester hydrolase